MSERAYTTAAARANEMAARAAEATWRCCSRDDGYLDLPAHEAAAIAHWRSMVLALSAEALVPDLLSQALLRARSTAAATAAKAHLDATRELRNHHERERLP